MRMRLLIGLLASVLAAPPMYAQETRGNINGVVEDAGGVVPGATVRVTNTETGQTQQLITGDRGYFEAVLLNPGTYAVRVELQGFKSLTQTGISLAVGQTVSLTLKLEVGQLTESIEVRESPSARTSCPSSIGAVRTSVITRQTTTSPRTYRTRSTSRTSPPSRRPTPISTSGCSGPRCSPRRPSLVIVCCAHSRT
jgi:hypothetical protein